MAGVNKAIIIGNLGRDPELRHTQSGKAVCELSVATSNKYKTQDGEKREDVQWHRIVVWGKQAEHCAEYLAKGRQVYVEGRMQTRSYEKDGEKRYITEVVAQSVQFIGGKRDSGSSSQREPPAGRPDFGDDDIPF